MKINNKIHIISHTHWDREWFLSAHYTREWLPPFFDSLFSILEREPQAKFVLDGQLVMVEDYFQLLQERGDDCEYPKRKLREFSQKGQLILGPYYLQPDWQLISEESAVRNLLAGARLAKEYGPAQSMGWLLDCFGQIAQTSQLHAGFDLRGIFVWRGVALEPDQVQTEFLWESPDGTKLPSTYLLDSYRNAMRLCWEPELIEGRIQYISEKLKPYSSTSNILFMNGYDQEMEPEDMAPLLREYPHLPLQISSPENYMDAVLEEQPNLLTLHGALYSGRYISVFPGILSTRMPIKQRNYFIEKCLERYLEPLAALAEIWGGKLFPLEQLQEMWCTVMKNHPHDTICGVSVDALYRDLEARCDDVEHNSEPLIIQSLSQLLQSDREKSLSVYNPSGFRYSAVVEVPPEFRFSHNSETGARAQVAANGSALLAVQEIPGLALMQLVPQPVLESNIVWASKNSKGVILGNRCLEVQIHRDGRLDLRDLQNDISYSGLHYFEDGADAGDTYNYSPCEQDEIISSKDCQAQLTILEEGPLRVKVRIALELQVPACLSANRKTRSSKIRSLPIQTVVSLEAEASQLQFRTELGNAARDHRLRICFPTGLQTFLSQAETQFAITEHEIESEPYSDEGLSTELKKILLGAREPSPVSCFPQRQFVDLSDGDKGLALLNKGLPEYEVLPRQRTIALTLFRSVGWLARTDLLERIGDAGPFIATPRAQLLQDMSFEYALYPHAGNWEKGQVLRQSEQFNYPVLVMPASPSGPIAQGLSQGIFVNPLPTQLKLSAFKKSEDGKAFILRLSNYSSQSASYNFSFAILVKELHEANLAEQLLDANKKLMPDNFSLQFRSFEVKTLRFSCPVSEESVKILDTVDDAALLWQEQKPVTCLFAKDWQGLEREPLVSTAELQSEEQRRQGLELQIAKLRPQWQAAKLGKQKIDLEMKLYTLERAYQEALISEIYLRENLENPHATEDKPEIQAKMHQIGLRLNKARVNKRAFEYIHQYYTEVLGV